MTHEIEFHYRNHYSHLPIERVDRLSRFVKLLDGVLKRNRFVVNFLHESANENDDELALGRVVDRHGDVDEIEGEKADPHDDDQNPHRHGRRDVHPRDESQTPRLGPRAIDETTEKTENACDEIDENPRDAGIKDGSIKKRTCWVSDLRQCKLYKGVYLYMCMYYITWCVARKLKLLM